MGIREEVAAITAGAEQARRIGLELEQEGADFWQAQEAEQTAQELRAEAEGWARDLKAVAEYEEWFIQKTLAEGDAESIAER